MESLFDYSPKVDVFEGVNPTKKDLGYYRKIVVHFRSYDDKVQFEKITGIAFGDKKELTFNPELLSSGSLVDYDISKREDPKAEKKFYWQEFWKDMPAFWSEDLLKHTYTVYFMSEDDIDDFARITGFKITDRTRFVWYPEQEKQVKKGTVWRTKEDVQPKYPLFIVSKGRASIEGTAKYLLWMGVKLFFIIVEEQEYAEYNKYFDSEHLLVLPKEYQQKYETVDPEGDKMGLPVGSGAARNFAWDTSIKMGYAKHWVMDDNIFGFYRFNDNLQIKMKTPVCFRAIEDFCDRYDNIYMAGMQYYCFIIEKSYRTPVEPNTRIYSCNLIRNDIPYRWRCRYNEDTDLSLRILKDGHGTALFTAFLANKANTQTNKGGNTDTIYHVGTGVKSRALARLHPDVTKVVYKYGRVHHEVNYLPFLYNKWELKPDFQYDGLDHEYGLYMDALKPGEDFLSWCKRYNESRGIINAKKRK